MGSPSKFAKGVKPVVKKLANVRQLPDAIRRRSIQIAVMLDRASMPKPTITESSAEVSLIWQGVTARYEFVVNAEGVTGSITEGDMEITFRQPLDMMVGAFIAPLVVLRKEARLE